MPRHHRDDKVENRKTVNKLLGLLKSDNLATLITAVTALASFGRDAIYTIEYIIPFIEHQDDILRNVAMYAIVDIAKGVKTTSESLRARLRQLGPTSDPYAASRIYWLLERIEQ